MKAILVDENKNLVWSDVLDPVVSDDEALVKIHAAALNRADLLQRQGKYPSPKGCPEWMGLEIAGEIVKIGKNVKGWSVGDCSYKDLLWDRHHLNSKHWHRDENEIVVHGHTPIPLMPQFEGKDIEIEPGAFWYCEGHKCNIDNGGFWTGNICLLDLNTWEEHIF